MAAILKTSTYGYRRESTSTLSYSTTPKTPKTTPQFWNLDEFKADKWYFPKLDAILAAILDFEVSKQFPVTKSSDSVYSVDIP